MYDSHDVLRDHVVQVDPTTPPRITPLARSLIDTWSFVATGRCPWFYLSHKAYKNKLAGAQLGGDS